MFNYSLMVSADPIYAHEIKNRRICDKLFSLAQYFKSCNGCYAWCPPCDARYIGYFCMMYVICANNFFVSKFIS